MKKLIVIVFCILISQSGFAQLFSKEKILNNENFDKDRFSYGYFLGFNYYGFDFDYNEEVLETIPGDPDLGIPKRTVDKTAIQVESKIGFNIGLLGNMRINDYLDLRFEPGLYITNRNLIYSEEYFSGMPDAPTDVDLIREIKSTYIHLPLLVKFSAKRLNNFKPFIVGGVSMSINLNSNEDNPNDNSSNQFRMVTNTYYYEIGVGIDFYLPYFKFTPSIRGVFGMNDELVRDNAGPDLDNPIPSPWTDNIASMKTQGIFVNFTFQ
ncbi:porin family protein [Formosa sp. PL04]|uniref:type IX secretion/gliding motility protein PorT/SprT n=1 Tax=Formosa sp. PL04 TaxID=3081755 RepID=UPI00298182C5|nr:porin family protein [Formosa sp. PL04]MDW5287846.1 porin family protein [Formosa sp. PL04]